MGGGLAGAEESLYIQQTGNIWFVFFSSFNVLLFGQVNIASLQQIASSLLIVCLDEEPQNVSDTDRCCGSYVGE